MKVCGKCFGRAVAYQAPEVLAAFFSRCPDALVEEEECQYHKLDSKVADSQIIADMFEVIDRGRQVMKLAKFKLNQRVSISQSYTLCQSGVVISREVRYIVRLDDGLVVRLDEKELKGASNGIQGSNRRCTMEAVL